MKNAVQPPAQVLILGSGIAGLSTALHLVEQLRQKRLPFQITVVAKAELSEGATRYAQGGIASVWTQEDSFAAHEQDTLIAGAGLCKPEVVAVCVKEGPARVRELLDWGVAFTRDAASGKPHLHREGGHTQHRILHAADLTGQEIERALIAKVKACPEIQTLENATAVDLITDRKQKPTEGRILGAYILNSDSQVITVLADAVVLATGGAGKAYLYTSNPDVATGDGIAMAYRAGADVANLEFMQFHPTCLYSAQSKTFLLTEALRGEGAELRGPDGKHFMQRYHPQGSLAPRDHVARAIDVEIKRAGAKHVWLDCQPIVEKHGEPYLREHFPTVDQACRAMGLDFARQWIPVVPACHYTCGGVVSDLFGQSTLAGLWVVGEVACTGLHGANRLASNSLLEAVVFAHRAAARITEVLEEKAKQPPQTPTTPPVPLWDPGQAIAIEEQVDLAASWLEIRTLLWNFVGIVRNERRLARARSRLHLIRKEIHADYWRYHLTRDLIELRNLLTVAELIVSCAISRKESRGLHFTMDYPNALPANQVRDTVLNRYRPEIS